MQPETENNENDLESTLESKLLDNLKWAMIFTMFNFICSKVDSEKDLLNKSFKTNFFKKWREKNATLIVQNDLRIINDILSCPKNMFHAILRNKNEAINSTELYQEKYNDLIKKIENFYNENLP